MKRRGSGRPGSQPPVSPRRAGWDGGRGGGGFQRASLVGVALVLFLHPEAAVPADDEASGSRSADTIELTAAQRAEVDIETVEVRERVVRRTLELPGRIRPAPDSEAYATTLLAGRIERIHVRQGEMVRRGEVLVEVASPVLADGIQALRAAHDELGRQRRLQERGVALPRQVRAAERAWQAARQRMRSLGFAPARIERVAESEEDVVALPLAAPIDGTVVERMAVLGAPVHAGEALVRLVDLQPVQVVAYAFERDLAGLSAGQPLSASTAIDPDRRFDSEIHAISPSIDEERRAASVVAFLPNEDGTLRPGAYATVRIELAGDRQPAVPSCALMSDARGSFVLVAEGDRRFRRRYVDAPADREGLVAVPELAPGTKVVSRGAFLLVSQLEQDR